MPAPAGRGQRYVPGLDGLRALAVLAVVFYHVNFGWAQGGLLGVGIFFTLSGYLITDLLLGQYAKTGRLQLLDFWVRRARRLLPALFVMLGVVAVWVSLLQRAQLAALRGITGAAAVYVGNWYLIVHNDSYFARFGPPSPLGHLWSLAVEEQFYLIWPWLVLLGLWVFRRRSQKSRGAWLASASLTLAAASAIAMSVLYHPGYDPTRIYDGTDTRAFGLLIGAALAFAKPSRDMPADPSRRSRLVLDGVGCAGLVIMGLLIWRTTQYSGFLFNGGLVLLSFATAAVVLAVVSPASLLGRALGCPPLRWIGVRSYGIYLWHYPIIVLTTPASGSESLTRVAAQIGATIVVSALSWHFIEEPVRHGAIDRWIRRLRSGSGQAAARGAWLNLGGALGAACMALVALAGIIPAAAPGSAGGAGEASSMLNSGQPAPTGQGASRHGQGGQGPGGQSRVAAPATTSGADTRAAVLDTECRSVVHIGDSTSDGLISASYEPNPANRISAQYHNVGVRNEIFEISGARSIVETYQRHPNAYTVAQQLVRRGYRGCWVLALGTNDTADVAVGSNVGLAARIRMMMAVTRGMPVLWVNVVSLLSSGPYSERNMRGWDQALLQACRKYPNMRVFDWAAQARRSWFISDGIHYTSVGYAYRARAIAGALAEAFPQPASLDRLPRVAARMLVTEEQDGCTVYLLTSSRAYGRRYYGGNGLTRTTATRTLMAAGASAVGEVWKSRGRLADGREIIYFDEEPGSGRASVPDTRELPARSGNEESVKDAVSVADGSGLRWDPLLREWTAIAQNRQERTFLPSAGSCPLCPSRPGSLTEIPAMSYDVVVFENKFPVFSGAAAAAKAQAELGPAGRRPATGRCEMVCFTPEHDSSFADLSPRRAGTVIAAWADRTAELGRTHGIAHVYCFENRGQEVGATLQHPHGQIYALPFVPPRTGQLIASAQAHRASGGGNLFDDRLAAELTDGRRIVQRNEHWIAFVPYAARWPFEVHLFPAARVPDLAALTGPARAGLAVIYPAVLRRLDALFGAPMPYMAAWQQAPANNEAARAEFGLFLQIMATRRAPGRLKFMASTESGAGVWSNDVLPETAARMLRQVG